MSKKFYFENLDGLRALAAFAVVFSHISYWIPSVDDEFYRTVKSYLSFNYQGGKFGVIFFFILSGFLISYLLFRERKMTDSINVKGFYVRRVLRIWPLYYVTLIIGFVLYPLFFNDASSTASPLLYIIFAANFDHIWNGDPGTGLLGVQWSVGVEEQFYLLWPLLFLLRNRKAQLLIFCGLLIGSEVYFFSHSDWNVRYYHLFSCIRFLAAGSLISYVAFFKEEGLKQFLNLLPKWMNVLIYCGAVGTLFYSKDFFEGILNEVIIEVVSILFFSYVILDQVYSKTSFIKLERFPWLTKLGKVSYGVYLLHMVAIFSVNEIFNQIGWQNFWISSLISIVLTLLLSFLSFTYLESYFLTLKSKFSGSQKSES